MQMLNSCLLIIDIQVDFCSSSGFAAKLGRKIKPMQLMLPKLKQFYRQLKILGIPVVFIQYVARKDLSPQNIRINKDREEKARICLLNSRGSHLYYFNPQGSDQVVEHRYYDAFSQSRLNQVLVKHQIKTLIITGVRTELSVDATAKRATNEGYEVIIAKDLINTYQEKQAYQRQFLELFDRYYGYVLTSREIAVSLPEFI